MRAITLWQPWASLIALGIKRTETRGFSTPYRGELAIHAAMKWTKNEREAAARFAELFPHVEQELRDPPRGVVVALVTLVDVYRCGRHLPLDLTTADHLCGNHTPGRYGWKLENIRPLETRFALKGRQSMWTLSDATAVAIRASLPSWTHPETGEIFILDRALEDLP